MRVIVRRPHAYIFLNETFADEGGVASAKPGGCVTASGTELPLPGLYVLDSEGVFVESTTINSVEEVIEMLEDPKATASHAQSNSSQTVSIRVSGFTAAEGIT